MAHESIRNEWDKKEMERRTAHAETCGIYSDCDKA
jgi:hypothetical protein